MVMEKSWNMKNWPEVEFCDQSWNLSNVAPELHQMCTFIATTKKLSINLESPHFPTFTAKCYKCKIEKRDGHGKSRNGHGKALLPPNTHKNNKRKVFL